MGALSCDLCRTAVCNLCRRRVGSDDLCLACATRLSAAAPRLTPSGAHILPAKRLGRSFIYATLAVTLCVTAMAVVAASALTDVRAARAEERAGDALREIAAAQQAWIAKHGTYGSLEELRGKDLVPAPVPGYELHVELSMDRRQFWARAVPTKVGLRALTIDGRGGKLVLDGVR